MSEHPVERALRLREAIATVALSHAGTCRCDVCEASRGNHAALMRVVLAHEEGRDPG